MGALCRTLSVSSPRHLVQSRQKTKLKDRSDRKKRIGREACAKNPPHKRCRVNSFKQSTSSWRKKKRKLKGGSSNMNNCEKCDHDFEKEGNFNFHKDALHKNSFYFDAVGDIESKFRCKICETKFETERELNEHKIAVWCEGCLTFWNCKVHNQRSKCTKCDEKLSCKEKYETHWYHKHKLIGAPPTKASKVKEASAEKEHNVDDSTRAIINSATTLSNQPETLINEDYENKESKEDDEYNEESNDNDIEEEEVKAEGDDTGTKESDDTDAEEEKVEAEEVREAEAIHDVTYICSLMLLLCGIATCNTYDITRRVWAKAIAHAQKLQEYNDEDDLKIKMPRATLVDIDIDDPSDIIGDTSIHDEAVYRVKSDPEVNKRRTVDDPAPC